MVYDSPFMIPLRRRMTVKTEGFDYHGKLMKNVTSNQMYNNEMLAGFMDKLDGVVCSWVDATKYVHAFNRISMDKNDKTRN